MNSFESRDDDMQSERMIFERASQLLKPGPFFRLVTHLYAERKLVVFFSIHFMCTMIVWGMYLTEYYFFFLVIEIHLSLLK